MTNAISITAEIVKMAQLRSRATGCDVRQESARQIAQEAILELDPELDLIIEEDAAYSSDDRLLSTLDVNDIVINGVRLDVRLVGDDGRISVPRYLVGTSYMNGGTLAVAIHANRQASVVGYVPRSDWDLQDKHAGSKEDRLVFRVSGQFNLAKLPDILASVKEDGQKPPRTTIHTTDIAQFCGQRQEMKLAKQRQFVEAVLHNESCWPDLQAGLSKSFVRRTLSHASVWNRKLDSLSADLQSRFPRLGREELKSVIARMGEQVGGNIESANFRKELLLNLSKAELSHALKGEQLSKAQKILEQVFAGRPVIDAVKDLVKSKAAMDLALTIKRQRQKLSNFMEASSDEISMAFRQLSLQPVYATHSQSPEGVESVNEALALLDAAELAEVLNALESQTTAG